MNGRAWAWQASHSSCCAIQRCPYGLEANAKRFKNKPFFCLARVSALNITDKGSFWIARPIRACQDVLGGLHEGHTLSPSPLSQDLVSSSTIRLLSTRIRRIRAAYPAAFMSRNSLAGAACQAARGRVRMERCLAPDQATAMAHRLSVIRLDQHVPTRRRGDDARGEGRASIPHEPSPRRGHNEASKDRCGE